MYRRFFFSWLKLRSTDRKQVVIMFWWGLAYLSFVWQMMYCTSRCFKLYVQAIAVHYWFLSVTQQKSGQPRTENIVKYETICHVIGLNKWTTEKVVPEHASTLYFFLRVHVIIFKTDKKIFWNINGPVPSPWGTPYWNTILALLSHDLPV